MNPLNHLLLNLITTSITPSTAALSKIQVTSHVNFLCVAFCLVRFLCVTKHLYRVIDLQANDNNNKPKKLSKPAGKIPGGSWFHRGPSSISEIEEI